MSDDLPVVPPRRRGFVHVIDAAGYSRAGLCRLWQEAAVRIELLVAICGGLLLAWSGAKLSELMIYAGLWLAVFIVETVNTALEVLTDYVSPNYSQAAKEAKDLGSAAVGLSLCAPFLFLLWSLLT